MNQGARKNKQGRVRDALKSANTSPRFGPPLDLGGQEKTKESSSQILEVVGLRRTEK